MKKETIRKLVLSAMFAALCCVATLVVQIPIATGYLNVGEGMCLLSGLVLGPWYGMAAAGLGSGLADLLAGYGVYVPATLIIKALVALTAAQCFRLIRANGRLHAPVSVLLAELPAEAVMVTGYYAFETVLLREPAAAAASVPNNLLQAAIGIVLASGLYLALSRVPEVRKQLWAA